MSDDYGYHWIETTTPAELNEGRRTYIRGRKVDPLVEPWSILTATGQLVGWVDERNQNRWLQPDHPGHDDWRRLYVEKGTP